MANKHASQCYAMATVSLLLTMGLWALQELGQRSLVAYLRSVFLQPNHDVFDVQKLPAAEYALSIGLPTAPKLRFLKNSGKHVKEVRHHCLCTVQTCRPAGPVVLLAVAACCKSCTITCCHTMSHPISIT